MPRKSKQDDVKYPKLYITTTREIFDRFSEMANRLGLSRSQFGSMCIQAGMSAVIRAVYPEEAFTSDQIVSIIQAAQKKGVQLDFTDFIPESGNE